MAKGQTHNLCRLWRCGFHGSAQAENAGKEATIDAKTAEAQEALEQLNALLGQSSAGSEKLREKMTKSSGEKLLTMDWMIKQI